MNKIKYSNVPSVPPGEFRLNGLQTNADRIRAMSDEELAEARVRYDSFRTVWLDGRNNPCETKRIAVARELDWLKQEADNPELGGDT